MFLRLDFPGVGIVVAASCWMAGGALADQSGDFTYLDHGATVTITAYPTSATGSVEIPPDLGGKPVSGIGEGAFKSCSGLTAISIPNSVTTLGAQAFYGCIGLTSMVLPPGLTVVPDELFRHCSHLTAVTLPVGLKTIGQNAFSFTLLEAVDIPPSVTFIDKWAFFQTSLTSVTIPSGVTMINQGTFSYCVNLTEVNLPDGLVTVDTYGFSSCPSLQTVRMPDSVETLGFGVFWRCTGLTGFKFPAGVTAIPDQLFYFCNKLRMMSIPETITSIGSRAFSSCAELRTITIGSRVTSMAELACFDCPKLTAAHFLGNSPSPATNLFQSVGPGFTVYYHTGKTGFSGFTRRVNVGAVTAASTWLIANSLPYNSSLKSDSNNDGVPLLMAYALGLDPNLNLSGSLPQPVKEPGGMKLSFFAGAEGVTYRVEASSDLVNWSEEAVVLSMPDEDGRSTATYAAGQAAAYLRLTASY